jgi:uncharacterized membrane protein YcaP (DUF421 family)
MPISDGDVPLMSIIVPLLVILSLEIIFSFASIKVNFLKLIFDGQPNALIEKGNLNIKELKKTRISLEELLSEVRLQGIPDLESVNYAILERNGRLSIIPKTASAPPTAKDMNISSPDKGIAHPLIVDGCYKKHSMILAQKDKPWVDKELQNRKLDRKNILLMTVNDQNETIIIKKERT